MTLKFWRWCKPLKSTGTHWIDHRIPAMGRLVAELGLYTRHLKEINDDNKNLKVSEKAKHLLRIAFLKDLMTTAHENF